MNCPLYSSSINLINKTDLRQPIIIDKALPLIVEFVRIDNFIYNTYIDA